jgi:hypothetical protein
MTDDDLAAALAAGDRRRFFRIVAEADLFLPAFADADPAAPQRFVTVDLFGQCYLPVFTSPAALTRSVGRHVRAYTITSYAELRAKWPHPAWRLAINPGSAIDAYVTVDAVAEAAAGALAVPTAAELLADGRADAVIDAAEHGDGERYLETLIESEVFVASLRPVSPGELLGGDFPWCIEPRPVLDPQPGDPAERPTIEVATLPYEPAEGTHGVVVPFTALVLAWPGPDHQMAVLTGGRTVIIPGTYVPTLAVTAAADL